VGQGVFYMDEILFILGLPGSGKSALARYIARYAKTHRWHTSHFTDYRILYEMFCKDTEHQQFEPAESGGFDVLEFAVLDEALRELVRRMDRRLSSSKTVSRRLIIVEFARNDYKRAFSLIPPTLLQNAHFLYLDVEKDNCKKRIRERVANPRYKDDYFVSDHIFETYYFDHDGGHIPGILEVHYEVKKHRIRTINNNGTLESAMQQITPFIDAIISTEAALKKTR
jgi:thymidylate kinase